MSDFDFRVNGLDKLQAALLEMGTNAARRAGRKAVRAGGKVILQATRDAAPVEADDHPTHKPGNLKFHGFRLVDLGVQGDVMKFSVFLKRNAFYGKFYELGTSHQPARPFMRPAAEAKSHDAVEAMTEVLAREIDAEALKLR